MIFPEIVLNAHYTWRDLYTEMEKKRNSCALIWGVPGLQKKSFGRAKAAVSDEQKLVSVTTAFAGRGGASRKCSPPGARILGPVWRPKTGPGYGPDFGIGI